MVQMARFLMSLISFLASEWRVPCNWVNGFESLSEMILGDRIWMVF